MCQLEGKLRNFLRCTQTVSGNLSAERFQILCAEAVVHGSVDDAGSDGIDLDVAGSQLLGKCFCQGIYTALGSRIGGFRGGACVPPHRGNIDDASPFFLHHGRNGEPAGIEAGTQVGVYDLMPVLYGHFRKQSEVGYAGIVDQNVGGGDGGKERFHGGRITHVTESGNAGDPGKHCQLLLHTGKGVPIMGAGDDKLIVGGRKAACDGSADASAGSGNQYGIHREPPYRTDFINRTVLLYHEKGKREMYDLIIIGSGPAGLSAAVYGMRAGLKLLVLEKNPMSGGQVLNTYEVDNYLGLPGIGGFEMGQKFREHAEKLGAAFREAEVTAVRDCGAVKKVCADGEELEARTLILAMGAHHAKLGVPGEEELAGMGVSYCATCDGAFFRNRVTAVVGGGDVAVEDAIFLSRFCKKVYLIHRRDSLRAAKVLQDELFALPNVEVMWNTRVTEIQGTEQVEALSLEDGAGKTQTLAVDGVFVAVGIHPDTEICRGLVACDENGYVIAGEDGVTSVPGIFAAGDARKKPLRQIITAVADGANAATSAGSYCV